MVDWKKCIEEIAYTLANVKDKADTNAAQHSVYISRLCKLDPLRGLLHEVKSKSVLQFGCGTGMLPEIEEAHKRLLVEDVWDKETAEKNFLLEFYKICSARRM